MDASLVMRDRETDSWWGMMAGAAIDGEMEGSPLVELPVGEKTTWGAWKRRYPHTLVLSRGGVTHESSNPYEGYFHSDRTYGDAELADTRMTPKAPIYAFRLGDTAYAVHHETVLGGALFYLGEDRGGVFFHREPGASIHASTVALQVPAGVIRKEGDSFVLNGDPALPLKAKEGRIALENHPQVTRLTGFDTFWYTWAGIHPGTLILE